MGLIRSLRLFWLEWLFRISPKSGAVVVDLNYRRDSYRGPQTVERGLVRRLGGLTRRLTGRWGEP